MEGDRTVKTYIVTIPDEYVMKFIKDTRDYVDKVEYVATKTENLEKCSHHLPRKVRGDPLLPHGDDEPIC